MPDPGGGYAGAGSPRPGPLNPSPGFFILRNGDLNGRTEYTDSY